MASRLPTVGPLSIRIALLLWQSGADWRLPDLSETLTGDRDRSAVGAAVQRLIASGLVSETRAESGRGVTLRWRGAQG